LAIPDYIPSTPGVWPGSSADALYINFLKLTYADEMLLRMQALQPKVANRAGRQIELTGYETRIDRWSKATLQQRQRSAQIGREVIGVVGPGGTVTVGVASAETGTANYVLQAVPWEYPEYFDIRDEMGLKKRTAALTDGAYKANVLGAMARKWDSAFIVALDGSSPVGIENGGSPETFAGGGGTAHAGTVKASDGSTTTFVTSFSNSKAIIMLGVLQQNDAFTGPEDNFLLVHPIQLQQAFIDSTKVLTSADFNTLRPLMSGEVRQYLGMSWIMSTEVPAVADIDTSTGTQAGHLSYAWNRYAMTTGTGQRTTRIDYVADRTSDLFYSGAFVGAVRTDGTGVVTMKNIDAQSFG